MRLFGRNPLNGASGFLDLRLARGLLRAFSGINATAGESAKTMNNPFAQPDVFNADRIDSLSAAAFLWSRTSVLKELFDLFEELRMWPGVRIKHARDGVWLSLERQVLAHVDWNGRIDFRPCPEVGARSTAQQLSRGISLPPHARRVVFLIRTSSEVRRALGLLRAAYLRLKSRTVVAC